MKAPKIRRVFIAIGITIAFVGCQPASNQEKEDTGSDGPVKVEVRKVESSYQLLRDGEPYSFNGAGLEFGDMKRFASHGGNAIRTWRTDNAKQTGQEVLDEAYKYGISVALCLEVMRERHGFDYDDEDAVKKQFEAMKAEVMKYKDHPALIMWVIGNELNHHYENPKVYNAVNDISLMIHELDPNHPTTTTTAGINKDLADVIKERAPDLDMLSIQMYGDIVNLPRYIEEIEWTKPYMVTEWGATGHWEVGTTEWKAPIEQTSSVKAKSYLDRYNQAIKPYGDQCVGSFVFLWGQKQERTPTWYGMFLPSGEETETIDVMHYIWNNEWPENRSPSVESFTLEGKTAYDNVYLDATAEYSANVDIADPEGDAITYYWEIKPESTDLKEGGDQESVPQSVEGLIPDNTVQNITFTSPSDPGAYRLFVYAYDGQGHGAHANIPFYVKE